MKKETGFTLIEFMIYGVIVSFMVGALIMAGSNIMEGRARVEVMQEVSHNARVALSRITYHIRRAEGVNVLNPGDESDELSLQMSDTDNDPTIFSINEDNALVVKKGTKDPVEITSSNIEVSFLKFTNLSGSSGKDSIRIEITVGHKNPTGRQLYDFEETFYLTETARR